MDAPNFRAIGLVIYGIQRLDAVFTSVTDMMTASVKSNAAVSSDKHEHRRQAAATYFSEHEKVADQAPAYLQMLTSFQSLEERGNNGGTWSGAADPLLVDQVRKLHFELADVLTAIGYTQFSRAFLTEHPNLQP